MPPGKLRDRCRLDSGRAKESVNSRQCASRCAAAAEVEARPLRCRDHDVADSRGLSIEQEVAPAHHAGRCARIAVDDLDGPFGIDPAGAVEERRGRARYHRLPFGPQPCCVNALLQQWLGVSTRQVDIGMQSGKASGPQLIASDRPRRAGFASDERHLGHSRRVAVPLHRRHSLCGHAGEESRKPRMNAHSTTRTSSSDAPRWRGRPVRSGAPGSSPPGRGCAGTPRHRVAGRGR